jgi:hypothetical protein
MAAMVVAINTDKILEAETIAVAEEITVVVAEEIIAVEEEETIAAAEETITEILKKDINLKSKSKLNSPWLKTVGYRFLKNNSNICKLSN